MSTGVACPSPFIQSFNNSGAFNVGGSILTQVSGVNTATYQDVGLTTPLPNPIPINSRGEVSDSSGHSQQLFLTPNIVYVFTYFDKNGNQIDQASYVNGVQVIQTQASIGALLYPTLTAETNAGVTVVNNVYPVGYVDRYVNNVSPGTTDTSAGFNAAFRVALVVGCAVRFGLTAPYATTNPINYTTAGGPNQNGVATIFDGGASCDFVNLPIIGNHTGHVFDCTGTIGLVFERLGITSGAATPKTGFFQARNVSGGSVGFSRFVDCNVLGSFSVANYYNFGAEDDQIIGGYWENNWSGGSASVAIWTSHNINAQTSTFQSLPAIAGCTDHKVFGGEWYRNGSGGSDDVMHLDFIESLKLFGPWMHCATGAASGRSLIYVDLTNGASSFCDIFALTGEQGGFVAKYGICIGNEAPQTVQNWTVDSCKFPNANFAISTLGTNGTVAVWNIRQLYDPSSHGLVFQGTVSDSRIDSGLPMTIGISLRNSLIGDTSSWTVTTRSHDSWYETSTTNRSFTVGIVSGSNGWTAVGAITQRGKQCYTGNMVNWSIVVAGATSIACTAGAQIQMPWSATEANTATIIDNTTGLTLGNAVLNANILTFPVAIGANVHTITVQGMAFVS